jgi:hypothetical protein
LDRAETLLEDSKGIGLCWGQVSGSSEFAKDLRYRSKQAVRILLFSFSLMDFLILGVFMVRFGPVLTQKFNRTGK